MIHSPSVIHLFLRNEIMGKLENKTAVITGGGSGIGEAITRKFYEEGARLHILEITSDAKKKFDDPDNRLFFHTCDVSDQQQVKNVIKLVADGNNKIDILINNAGIAHIGNAENTEEAAFDRVCRVNIKGIYNCIHAAIPYMKKNKGGSIVNMASVASHVGVSDRFAYSATKGAALAMTYSVAKDFVKENIRCNSISPARVHTPFVDGFLKENYPGEEERMFDALSASQPIGRMGKPEEIAGLALYLCSDEAAFITGSDFPIDGGFIKLNT